MDVARQARRRATASPRPFLGAAQPGRRARAVAPVAIAADAQIELGRYAQGFAAVQRRIELRPDLPSYSRASYARELQGDRARARSA